MPPRPSNGRHHQPPERDRNLLFVPEDAAALRERLARVEAALRQWEDWHVWQAWRQGLRRMEPPVVPQPPRPPDLERETLLMLRVALLDELQRHERNQHG